jgi:hypothetical protein
MKLDDIIIQEAEEQCESLALSLRAVAATQRVDLDYDDLCAVLGLSFTAAATVVEPSPGWWTTYGRDAFLESAAKLFGFQVRDLHPPDVAVDMLSAEEFAQHWELSYRPLIEGALENRQPVLAWQGWPDYRWPFWGVITGKMQDDFVGTTLWANGQRLTLTQPALQCYVVEQGEPFAPPAMMVLRAAVTHANEYMNRAPFSSQIPGQLEPKIVTGPAAFDAWEAWLQSGDLGAEAWNDHRQNAEFIAIGRLSAARFLRRMRAIVEADIADMIDEAVSCCESLVSVLERSRDEAQAQSFFHNKNGREQLLADIMVAESADRRLARCVEELASQVDPLS